MFRSPVVASLFFAISAMLLVVSPASATCSISGSCCSATVSCTTGTCTCASVCHEGQISACWCTCATPGTRPTSPFSPSTTRIALAQEGVTLQMGAGTIELGAFGKIVQEWFGWGVSIPEEMMDDPVGGDDYSGTFEDAVEAACSDAGMNATFDSANGVISFGIN